MIINGNALALPLADESVHCCVTSPPYWGLRDYGNDAQIGLEQTPDEYVARLVAVFREVHRVLRDDGTLWLNLGDSYVGSANSGGHGKQDTLHYATGLPAKRAALPPKSLVGIPWRVAFALHADGWILRSDIIWAKPNPMPESVRDRPTKSHEYMFLLAKRARYYFDQDAVRQEPGEAPRSTISPGAGAAAIDQGDRMRTTPIGRTCGTHPAGRNIRDVWTIATQPYPGAHFAVMHPALVEPCVKAGSPEGGVVLDPFAGAETVGLVADRLRRRFVGVELNPAFARLAADRIRDDCPLFAGVGE
jgi:DNA modification methylase